jgi:hypothetical protein
MLCTIQPHMDLKLKCFKLPRQLGARCVLGYLIAMTAKVKASTHWTQVKSKQTKPNIFVLGWVYQNFRPCGVGNPDYTILLFE